MASADELSAPRRAKFGFDVKIEGKKANWRFSGHFSSCLGLFVHRRNRNLDINFQKKKKNKIIAHTNDEIATVEDYLLATDWQHLGNGSFSSFFFFAANDRRRFDRAQ